MQTFKMFENEELVILLPSGKEVIIKPAQIMPHGKSVRIGIQDRFKVSVWRKELWEKMKLERKSAL